jgi:hypothetical protein
MAFDISKFRGNRMMWSSRWRENNKQEEDRSVGLFILIFSLQEIVHLSSQEDGPPLGINGAQSGVRTTKRIDWKTEIELTKLITKSITMEKINTATDFHRTKQEIY